MMNGKHHKLSALFKLAVLSGVPAAVQHHLDKGADIEARDASGATPLIIAATKGRSAVVELLLEKGADPRAVDASGLDALAHATKREAWGIVELLTRALEVQLRRGQTIVAVSAFVPQVDAVSDVSVQLPFCTVEPVGEGSEQSCNDTASSSGVTPGADCDELAAVLQGPVVEPILPVETVLELDSEHELNGTWEEDDVAHPSFTRDWPDESATDTFLCVRETLAEDDARRPQETQQDFVEVHQEEQLRSPSISAVPEAVLSGGGVSCPAVMLPAGKTGLSLDENPSIEPTGIDDWEAETPSVAPMGDSSLAELTLEVQRQIGSYKPVDDGEDWDEIEVDLPVRVRSIEAFGGDTESPFRYLLAQGLKEGMLARQSVVNACTEEGGDVNNDLERAMEVLAEDLGFRIVDGEAIAEDCSWPLSGDDEALLDEAVIFLEEFLSNRENPFRHYQREMTLFPRLSTQDEVELGQAIERAGREAVAALSRWSFGITLVLEAAAKVQTGRVNADLYIMGPNPAQGDESSSECGGTEKDLDEVAALFLDAADELKEASGDVSRRENALKKVKFSIGFLSDLAETAKETDEGREFVLAVRRQSVARERMIVCNLRLAFSIARKFLWSGLPVDDLIQEANIGLMKAVERYEWRKGLKFSTYATWWIRQSVSRAVANHARLVRTPVHFQDEGWKLLRSREGEFSVNGQIETEVRTAERMGLPVSRVRALMAQFEEVVSLEDPCLDLHVLENLRERLTDDASWQMAEQRALRQKILGAMGDLDERARDVIVLRFGLSGEDAMTLEEIGNLLGVTRERIRQIEAKALKKLARHPCLSPPIGREKMLRNRGDTRPSKV